MAIAFIQKLIKTLVQSPSKERYSTIIKRIL